MTKTVFSITREEDLRRQAEEGRKAQIASEVLDVVLDCVRNEQIDILESSMRNDDELRGCNVVLWLIRTIRSRVKDVINNGTIAEEELANGE